MAHRDTINEYLKKFGESVDVEFDPLDETGYTQIARGSAVVGINVFDDQNSFYLLAPIMPVPGVDKEKLYRQLLELNYRGTSEAAFAIDKSRDEICVRLTRGLDGLDYEEFVRALNIVSAVADQWDDRLKEAYGAKA